MLVVSIHSKWMQMASKFGIYKRLRSFNIRTLPTCHCKFELDIPAAVRSKTKCVLHHEHPYQEELAIYAHLSPIFSSM